MPFSARQVLTAAQLNDLSVNTVTTTGDITVGGSAIGNPGFDVVIDASSASGYLRLKASTNTVMSMSFGRQLLWGAGASGFHGNAIVDRIIGTTASIGTSSTPSLPSISGGATWTNLYTMPLNDPLRATSPANVYRYADSPLLTAYCLWGFSCYTNTVSRKRTRILMDATTGTDYATPEQYFFFNQTSVHQGWSFQAFSIFPQTGGFVNVRIQLWSDSGSWIVDPNDYAWVWLFIR